MAAAERRAAAKEAAAEEERAAEAKAQAEEQAARQAAYEGCVAELAPLRDALDEIDARLDVGLVQRDLNDLVGDASVAYSKIDVDALGEAECLHVGGLLETALNAYITSNTRWNGCITDYDCDVDDDAMPFMQKQWSKASDKLDEAETLLDSLDPASEELGSTS